MGRDLVQIAPGVWVPEGGANQAIANRHLPATGIPQGPNGFKRRFRAGPEGSVLTVDAMDVAEFNGELVIPVGIASISVLPESIGVRNVLGFRNSSAAACNIFLAFGGPASANSWLLLVQNTMVLLDQRPPQDEVFAICSTAAGQLTVVLSITPGDFS